MILNFVNAAVAVAAAIGSFALVVSIFVGVIVFGAKVLHATGKKLGYWGDL